MTMVGYVSYSQEQLTDNRIIKDAYFTLKEVVMLDPSFHPFRIKHDNVVGLEDFYESRTHYYLVMQL